jgi:transcription-repair coupling factor (superfamily II helicase)
METEDELIDRFGDIPRAVSTLIDIACIKAAARECGICEITQKNGKIIFVFTEQGFDLQAVLALPRELKIKLIPTAKRPSMECAAALDVTGNIKFILQSLKELKCKEK